MVVPTHNGAERTFTINIGIRLFFKFIILKLWYSSNYSCYNINNTLNCINHIYHAIYTFVNCVYIFHFMVKDFLWFSSHLFSLSSNVVKWSLKSIYLVGYKVFYFVEFCNIRISDFIVWSQIDWLNHCFWSVVSFQFLLWWSGLLYNVYKKNSLRFCTIKLLWCKILTQWINYTLFCEHGLYWVKCETNNRNWKISLICWTEISATLKI